MSGSIQGPFSRVAHVVKANYPSFSDRCAMFRVGTGLGAIFGTVHAAAAVADDVKNNGLVPIHLVDVACHAWLGGLFGGCALFAFEVAALGGSVYLAGQVADDKKSKSYYNWINQQLEERQEESISRLQQIAALRSEVNQLRGRARELAWDYSLAEGHRQRLIQQWPEGTPIPKSCFEQSRKD